MDLTPRRSAAFKLHDMRGWYVCRGNSHSMNVWKSRRGVVIAELCPVHNYPTWTAARSSALRLTRISAFSLRRAAAALDKLVR
jgi:hypothetical protein